MNLLNLLTELTHFLSAAAALTTAVHVLRVRRRPGHDESPDIEE
jgi:hypothetical protein